MSSFDRSDVGAKTRLPIAHVDCASRRAACGSRCCTLRVALTEADLEDPRIDPAEWDEGRGRKRADGYCIHHEDGLCGIYDRRPEECRVYDCRYDPRIWADFAAMIPVASERVTRGEPSR